ncbi:MAG: rhamnose ABC transporter substrate-binding protein [Alphaproteobacteria bacterium]
MKILKKLTFVFAAMAFTFSASAKDIRIAMVPKSLGNAFFEATQKGGEEAAAEIGGVELIFNAPAVVSAEGQIEVINSLIAQRVDAIVVSSNDPDALVPVAQKAMKRGIVVTSFDSAIAKDGRMLHLNPATSSGTAETLVKLMKDAMGEGGEIAIVSETAQSTNQNEWIAEIKKLLEKDENKGLKLVETVYGDALLDKSYRETVALIRRYPNLKGIISPTTVGISAAAKAVEDQGLIGKIYVTGLALPSEVSGYVHTGSIKSFAIWNPIDLGYTATYLTYQIIKDKEQRENLDAGRMGKYNLDDNNETSLPAPFIFDASNVDEYADIF